MKLTTPLQEFGMIDVVRTKFVEVYLGKEKAIVSQSKE